MVDIREIPFNQTMLKQAVGTDEVEFYNINLRSEAGGRTLELKLTAADGSRRVVVLADRGFQIEQREVPLRPYLGRIERNEEIRRLYK